MTSVNITADRAKYLIIIDASWGRDEPSKIGPPKRITLYRQVRGYFEQGKFRMQSSALDQL
jgi:hypothetical protein